MSLPSQSVHPAQTLYPLSPHPSEATWTPSMTTSASPSVMEGQQLRAWEPYESVGRSPLPSWEIQFSYAASGSFVGTRHSPAPSDGHIMSQRSSVSSSYDNSLYSHDGSESTYLPEVKLEPQNEWRSDEDSLMCQQPLIVSPGRLCNSNQAISPRYGPPADRRRQLNTSSKGKRAKTIASEEGRINTSTARTRSRNATTAANANYACQVCGKMFQRSYNHKAHMETHDPERPHPHVCQTEHCERAFVRRTDLQRHEQSVGTTAP
ncbi:Zinc finger C2H2-type protein [Macrophomina phaseolina MS6]|uniref:C2H2 type master regulator of conidiophore development brlA n=1 Tax=Macrophomina phaseolina (strain MS6) TaxID=1126212 RepID=K2RKK0_MACPH|nr:Zinc finger C2H2-type protein [Macrophomina phaseolina MS6]